MFVYGAAQTNPDIGGSGSLGYMSATPDNVLYHDQYLDLAVTNIDTKFHGVINALTLGCTLWLTKISDSQLIMNHLKDFTRVKKKNLRALHLRARGLRVNFVCNRVHDLLGWNQAGDLLCKVAPNYWCHFHSS